MFDLIYDFFWSIIFYVDDGTRINLDSIELSLFGGSWKPTLAAYLCTIASIISVIFIFVLCCLFVYKIIKLIGGLIR